jgi:hypothetical protein
VRGEVGLEGLGALLVAVERTDVELEGRLVEEGIKLGGERG